MPTPSGDASPRPYNPSKARRGPRRVSGTSSTSGRRPGKSPHYLDTAEARALCDHLDTKLPPLKHRKTFQSLSFKKFHKRKE